MMAHCLHIC